MYFVLTIKLYEALFGSSVRWEKVRLAQFSKKVGENLNFNEYLCIGVEWKWYMYNQNVNNMQGWKFALTLFRSKSLSLKSDREQRETRANRSLTKSDMSDSLVFWERNALSLFCSQKIHCFHHVFWQFFTAFSHFKPKIKSLMSLFAPSLYFKERFAHGHSP